MDDTLGSVLRGLRHATGQTLEDVAEATGISVAMLSRAERNQRIPSPQTVLALARHYRVPAEELQGHAIAQRSQSRGADDLSNQWAARSLLARSMGPAELIRSSAPPPMTAPPSMAAPSRRFGAMRASGHYEDRLVCDAGIEDDALMAGSPAYADEGPSDPALDALTDAARVAEVAVESAMTAARRAIASGDERLAAEGRRVLERLRRATEG